MNTSATRLRFTATYMWPGSFFNETSVVEISEGTLEAALAAMPDTTWHGRHAFGFEIGETTLKRFISDDGEERWLATGPSRKLGRWYFGVSMSIDDVAAENVANAGEYVILLSNMRGNGWHTVVRTVAGIFQPVEEGDTVLLASQHPYYSLDREPS